MERIIMDMRVIVASTLMVMAQALASPAVAPPLKIRGATLTGNVEGVLEYKWPNGFRAVLLPDGTKPNILVNMVVLVGSRYESYGVHGISHLLEHMLFRRTKRFASIKDELTKIGGRVSGITMLDTTTYTEEFLATEANLNQVINLEADRLRSAIFSQETVKIETDVVRNENLSNQSIPAMLLNETVRATAFRWHNYGKSGIGHESDLDGISRDKLIAWYDTYYQPDNALMLISGGFELYKVLLKLDETFGRMPRPKRKLPSTYTREPAQTGERFAVERRVGGDPLIIVYYHAPALSNPDAVAFGQLGTLLDSKPSGRLYQALVKADKAAIVGCMVELAYEPAAIRCGVKFKPSQNVQVAKEILLSTLEQSLPFTADEVDRAKRQALNNIRYEQMDVHALNASLTNFVASDWRYYFLFRDKTEQLTAADINHVAHKYLVASNRTLGEFIPTDATEVAPTGPRADNPGAIVQGYVGRSGKVAPNTGEQFDTSLSNLEAHTTRGELSAGTKYAFLLKKTEMKFVSMVANFYFGTEAALANRRVDIANAIAILPRGTNKRSRIAFEDELSNLSAVLEVSVSDQALSVHLRVPSGNLDKALALVGEMLREPAFDADEFAESVGARMAVGNMEFEEPVPAGRSTLIRALYPREQSHYLYAPSFDDVVEELRKSSLEKAKSAYQSFIGPKYASVAFVGEFEPEKVRAQLEAIFNGWTAPEKYVKIAVPYHGTKVEEHVILSKRMSSAISYFASTLPLSDGSREFPHLVLANYILGGGYGSGRIAKKLRENQGLSYHSDTRILWGTGAESSLFIAKAQHEPNNRDRVKAVFKNELAHAIRKGFTKTELQLAKEGFLQARRLAFTDDGYIAGKLAELASVQRTLAFEVDFELAIERATLDEVNAALRKYINFDSMVYVSVGDFPTN